MTPDRDRLRLSALIGFLAIVLGSLGAHGRVHDIVKAAGELEHWQTAVQYHMPHAIMLVVLALCATGGGKAASWSWRCFLLGIVLFCGSLYALAITQQKWLAHVTPFGGLSLMAGWMLLAVARWPSSKEARSA